MGKGFCGHEAILAEDEGAVVRGVARRGRWGGGAVCNISFSAISLCNLPEPFFFSPFHSCFISSRNRTMSRWVYLVRGRRGASRAVFVSIGEVDLDVYVILQLWLCL